MPLRVLNGLPSSPSTVPNAMCWSSTSSIAPQPGRGEELLEVERLAMIDDVQNRVGLPLAHAVLNRGQVGRGVEKRAVLLLDDHRHVVAFEEHADRAVALAGEALVGEVLHDAAQAVLIETLAERVVERDAEPLVDRVRSRPGRRAGTRRHSSTFVGSPACSAAVSGSTCWPMSACAAASLLELRVVFDGCDFRLAGRSSSARSSASCASACSKSLGGLLALFGIGRRRSARRAARRCFSASAMRFSSAGIFSLRVS